MSSPPLDPPGLEPDPDRAVLDTIAAGYQAADAGDRLNTAPTDPIHGLPMLDGRTETVTFIDDNGVRHQLQRAAQ